MSSQHTGNLILVSHRQSRRFTGTFWKRCLHDALFTKHKPKKCVPTSGEERPQQAKTRTTADSEGFTQQGYKMKLALRRVSLVSLMS